ncbi:glycosyltransferase [Cytobacillus massiliigabonensis]|uniref:glycosyltransferase n=1 Tax=Cytobacillus massiliigabonensis TaxID=1871011 RepID=UPI00115759A1|nr:glycosyltransferase [Cytobacillus massiliigabonensis]
MRIIQKLYDIYQKDGPDFVTSLYRELLLREANSIEIEHYQNLFMSGYSKISLIQSILQSNECMQYYNHPPAILARQNQTVAGILRTFFQSNETLFVQSLYRELLYREPDIGGLYGFVGMLKKRGSRFTVLGDILTSEECMLLLSSPNPPWKGEFEDIVSCIIPSFNQVDLVKQCVNTLKSMTTKTSYEIIVVDDGSTMHIQQQLLEWGSQENIKVILKNQNQGFSCTVNQGIRNARGKHIALVNNDIIFHQPDWLEKMLSTIKSSPEIGVVGARLLYPNQTIQHGGMGADLYHRYVGLAADYAPALAVNDVHAVTGALFLIKQDAIADLGLFSEDFFTGFEDVEFCFRARLKGWRVVYCGPAAAIHLEGQTRGGHQKIKYYMLKDFEAGKQFDLKWRGYYHILKS